MRVSVMTALGIFLMLMLVLGMSVVTVAAQSPTGTPSPTTAASPTSTSGGASPTSAAPAASSTPFTAPTPQQAPPAAAAGTNLDDPARAIPFGNNIQAIPAHSAQWYSFQYDNGGPSNLPRPVATIRMLNAVTNGEDFEVWSPERLVGNWFDNQPVGRGNTETVLSCQTTNPDGTTSKCTTNDLFWTGGFGLSGTYYVRVVNNTNNPISPEIIISGPGITQCSGANTTQANQNQTNQNQNETNNPSNNQANNQTNNQSNTQANNGQPFVRIDCSAPAIGAGANTLNNNNSNNTNNTNNNGTSNNGASGTPAPSGTTTP